MTEVLDEKMEKEMIKKIVKMVVLESEANRLKIDMDLDSEIIDRWPHPDFGWVYLITHLDLICPHCAGEAIIQYIAIDEPPITFGCMECDWVDDGHYIKEILGIEDKGFPNNQEESFSLGSVIKIFNPHLLCHRCDNQGLVEYILKNNEVKFFGCLNCGWFSNRSGFLVIPLTDKSNN